MQTVYKLRHIPTGLFYKPVTGRWSDNKSNLNEHGKIYSYRKPSLKDVAGRVQMSITQRKKYNIEYDNRYGFTAPIEDWEIVEFELKEINK